MSFTSQPLRILLVARNDERAHVLRDVLAASTIPPIHVKHATNGWEAQRHAAVGTYDGVVLEHCLGDTDSETLLGRLKAIGVRGPALVLTSTAAEEQESAGRDGYLSETDALHGNTLVRAILAMIQHHNLTEELATARAQLAGATTVLAELAHDLATPLGVVMGMTQLLLSDDNGLNADGRACLEDVSEAAVSARKILKRLSPLEPGASPVAAPTTHVPTPGRATRSGPASKLVLIADDDPATRRLVCATLVSDQYCVLQAADGEEAWRLIREHHPAVAILDWQMPVYSGLELSDVIKGDPQVQGMTVIMLTGRNTQADREAGARARADLYLIKPFSPQELLGAVEQALRLN